jgi:hypothetical protein
MLLVQSRKAWSMLALFAVLGMALLGMGTPGIAVAEEPEEKSTEPPKPAGKLSKAEVARNKVLKAVETTLKRLKPVTGKATLEDYFLVGRVELTLLDRSAKVEFDVLKGQKDASEQIVEYLGGSSATVARNWQAFARFGDEDTARKGLEQIRDRYDRLQAYRAELMKAYQAASMCRT